MSQPSHLSLLVILTSLAAACDARPFPAPSPTPLPATVTFSGVVRDEAGTPVAGARVEATAPAGVSTTSAENGSYTLTVSSAGRPVGSQFYASIRATHEGYEPDSLWGPTNRVPHDFRLPRTIRLVESVSVDVPLTVYDQAYVDDDGFTTGRYRTVRILPKRRGTLTVHVVPEAPEATVVVGARDNVTSVWGAAPISLTVEEGRDVAITIVIDYRITRAYAFTVTAVINAP